MQVNIELPDWVEEGQAIRIFAGIELVAKKMMNEPWQIKTVRCDMCGECCTINSPGWQDNTVEARDDGFCVELIPKPDEDGKFLCALGSNRPFGCCAYGAGDNQKDMCCIRWEILN